jgi:3-oxoacyl-[acyl-carrier protein] reductase
MSGIYILKLKDGFRVAYSKRYEDMIGSYDDSSMNYQLIKKVITEVFGDKKTYTEYSDAVRAAVDISKKYPETDDGIFVMRHALNKTFDEVVNVNLKFPFFLTKHLLGNIKNNSSIVNISSFSAISGGPISSHYAIAKSGLETLTKNLAIFFKSKKIRVNAISPGLIKTRLAKFPKKHPYFSRIILSRAGKKEEIAKVIKFLLSDSSSYINGQTINVDGGMFLK